MPIRNPFAKRGPEPNNGYLNGLSSTTDDPLRPANPGFERVDTDASKTSSAAQSFSTTKSQEPAEYKLSVVNDSGVYLPPSPPIEKKSFWSSKRSQPSSTSINTNSDEQEIDPFTISRESFDSYRRSFDIGARTPVLNTQDSQPLNGRQSLDSARAPRLPRSALNNRSFERQPPTAEEGFEDVGLDDSQNKAKEQPKKKGFFSKFGSEAAEDSTGTSRFHIPGRKRGSSGQGAELGNITDKPEPVGASGLKGELPSDTVR